MNRAVPIRKPQQSKPADPYKALVMDCFDTMTRDKKRNDLWAKEEVRRQAKSKL